MEKRLAFIDGRFVPSSSDKVIQVVNPSTEEIISEFPACTVDDVNLAVTAAERAQKGWAKKPAFERARRLHEISQGVRKRREELARTISEEQGKILPLSRTEVDFAADYIDYMAEFARRSRARSVLCINGVQVRAHR